MKLEDQVVNLELSKRLKELNVKQESLYFWSLCSDCVSEYGAKGIKVEVELTDSPHGDKWSAFNVAELGKMLPPSITNPNVGASSSEIEKPIILQKSKENDFYVYIQNENGSISCVCGDETEANARAKMLIFLLENDLIKL